MPLVCNRQQINRRGCSVSPAHLTLFRPRQHRPYLELQKKWPFFNRKSSFFRGDSPLSLHFQMKVAFILHLYCSTAAADQSCTKFLVFDTQFLVFDTQFLVFDTQFLDLNTQFLVLNTKFMILLTCAQHITHSPAATNKRKIESET